MATVTLEGLIVKEPKLRGSRPIIAGTGVTVRTIVGHYTLGLWAEEIADEMNLALAGVYAALAYYHCFRVFPVVIPVGPGTGSSLVDVVGRFCGATQGGILA